MKNYVVSWINSLKMLAPENFKPLALVTLKTFLEVYKTVFKYFWWFLAIGSVPMWLLLKTSGSAGIIPALQLTIWTLGWLSLWLLLVRPSVELKNGEYFLKHILLWLFFSGLILLAMAFHSSLTLRIVVMPYVIFLSFFIGDTDYTILEIIRAPWRALKMSVALLPLYLMSALFLYGTEKLFRLFAPTISYTVSLVCLLFFILPLFIVFMSRLYVITIHKNYKEYYERCW